MKIALRIFGILFFGLFVYLIGIRNISIRVGDENSSIEESEWFEGRNPHISEIQSKEGCKHCDLQEEFEGFLYRLNGSPLYQTSVVYLDTTGDGVNERISTTVFLENGLCTIQNSIKQDGKILWQDEFQMDKGHVRLAMGEKYTASCYLPYALYFLGNLRSNFIEYVEDEAEISKWKHILQNNRQEGIANTGYFIFELQDHNKGIYYWNSEKKAFTRIISSNGVNQVS